MYIEKIRGCNILSYKNVDLDLSKVNLLGVIGANESGKSSLLEIIEFVNFNQGRDTVEKIRMDGTESEEFWGEVTYIDNNDKYIVYNGRTAKKGKKSNSVRWIKKNGDTEQHIIAQGEDCDQAVFNLLKMKQKSFNVAAFLAQGKMNLLAESTPSERKGIIEDVLDISIWQTLEQEFGKKSNEIEMQIQALNNNINFVMTTLDAMQKSDPNKERENIVNAIAVQNQSIREFNDKLVELKAFEDIIKNYELLKSKYDIIEKEHNKATLKQQSNEKEINLIQLKINDFNKSTSELTTKLNKMVIVKFDDNKILELRNKEKEIVSKTNEIKIEINNLERTNDSLNKNTLIGKNYGNEIKEIGNEILKKMTEISIYKNNISNMIKLGNECPTCHQKITEDLKHNHQNEQQYNIDKLNTEIMELNRNQDVIIQNVIEKCNNEIDGNKIKIEELKKKIDEEHTGQYQEITKEIEKQERFKNVSIQATLDKKDLQNKIDGHNKDIKNYTSNVERMGMEQGELFDTINKYKSEMEVMKKDLEKFSDTTIVEFSNIKSNMMLYQQKINECNNIVEHHKKQLILTEQKLKDIQDLMIQIEQFKIKIDIKSKKELVIFNYLKNACSKQGLPAIIVENAMHEAANYSNKILRQIFPMRSIIYETLKENSSGIIRETLDISIYEDGEKHNLARYSGGASDVINFCINLGISSLAKSRSQSKIEFLICDEVFKFMDDSNTNLVLDLIKVIRNEYKQIFIVTHRPFVKEILPCIEVVKNNGISTIRAL